MNNILAAARRVTERSDVTADIFVREVQPGYTPVVLRGIGANWPAVAVGRAGPRGIADYLRRFGAGRTVNMFAAAPAVSGRFFYAADHSSFNFESAQVAVPIFLDTLVAHADDPNSPSLYAGSAPAAEAYPGWTQENVLPLPTPGATPRIWVGNRSRASTHYDVSDNVALVVSGRRRFALFPPEQIANLYVGPLENTIAGQPTSMVDLEAPDLEAYPLFAHALEQMQVAELEPGDAIFIPSLWWHDVRATGPLNVLVNYWWGQGAGGSPMAALMHAVLAIRELPAGQRAGLRAWFDHYVFEEGATQVADHLPEQARGVLAPPSPQRDHRIREFLLRTLA
ncbi:cupin-like domain-containing protein [Sphingomonas xinjiangensis]|uniref:JmjC domain-containing protein n=1 Tax=Sphingomonas xinjiangensis TaxID=643568 RepID=A0A840YSL2_9SPHN|nr:cupin-like domain-containing protein [Sphingomonas xinjiangensis]MBB5712664.1 hypothetical protein [Sphingomonas xinjiangensis]